MPENTNSSTMVEPPLMTSATVLPPDTTVESVATALLSAVMSILSVDENLEIAAKSPSVPTVLTTEATRSVLSPPEKSGYRQGSLLPSANRRCRH